MSPHMTRYPLLRVLLASIIATAIFPAFASSFAGTTGGATSGGASNTSGSTSGDDKVILQARDDAAGFVASDGRIRGAQLEAALRLVRERHEAAQGMSDMQLARAILAR